MILLIFDPLNLLNFQFQFQFPLKIQEQKQKQKQNSNNIINSKLKNYDDKKTAIEWGISASNYKHIFLPLSNRTKTLPSKLHYFTNKNSRQFVDEYIELYGLPEVTSTSSLSKYKDDNNDIIKIISNQKYKKVNNSLVFIAITTSIFNIELRNAIRNTWLLPCIMNDKCDYKFFCDVPFSIIIINNNNNINKNINNKYIKIKKENDKFRDIVFRDNKACDFIMQRHPLEINYGNSPPKYVKKNKNSHIIEYKLDYDKRRAYKIDWKACFAHWAMKNNRMSKYHIYVEDDSFVCMDNLIYQLNKIEKKLKEIKKENKKNKIHENEIENENEILPFRTGTPLFDGFDDSSTIMNLPVAKAFATFYPNDIDFNCSHLFDLSLEEQNTRINGSTNWLSWGNSWRSDQCNWRHLYWYKFRKKVATPFMNCFLEEGNIIKYRKYYNNNNLSDDINHKKNFLRPHDYVKGRKVDFPCRIDGLIRHHQMMIVLLLSDPLVHHTCEYSLLLDKIKSPTDMYVLWRIANETNYIDFSEVFMNFGGIGWDKIINDYELKM